ncbi:MAG: helix-turn-helix domain-containing protein [Planctomycetes bacterium]|nr:helix-turn-helix domain-containing protein [Planctomycetota bacterium]
MQLTLREAATLLGCNGRTLRARLARGDVPGQKRGSKWLIDSDAVPLTSEQRARLEGRAAEIRQTVEDQLGRMLRGRRSRRRSLLDLDAYRAGSKLLRAAAELPLSKDDAGLVRARLRAGMLSLAEGAHAFDPGDKVAAFRATRRCLSPALATVLLASSDPLPPAVEAWVVAMEQDMLPSIAGLLRWSEGLSRAVADAARDVRRDVAESRLAGVLGDFTCGLSR